MKRRTIAAWAVGLTVGLAQAAQTRGGLEAASAPSAKQPADSGVEITSERFAVDQKTGWITATSNAVIRTAEHEMKADRVRLNRETGDVQASGNVA